MVFFVKFLIEVGATSRSIDHLTHLTCAWGCSFCRRRICSLRILQSRFVCRFGRACFRTCHSEGPCQQGKGFRSIWSADGHLHSERSWCKDRSHSLAGTSSCHPSSGRCTFCGRLRILLSRRRLPGKDGRRSLHFVSTDGMA